MDALGIVSIFCTCACPVVGALGVYLSRKGMTTLAWLAVAGTAALYLMTSLGWAFWSFWFWKQDLTGALGEATVFASLGLPNGLRGRRLSVPKGNDHVRLAGSRGGSYPLPDRRAGLVTNLGVQLL